MGLGLGFRGLGFRVNVVPLVYHVLGYVYD